MGLIKNDFLISTSEDMWNVIALYWGIFKMGLKALKHS